MSYDSFLQHLQFEKRYSPHTVISYKTDLIQFQDFLLDNYKENNLHNANHNNIRSWIIYLMGKEIQPKSINRKIASLRAFYNFSVRQEILFKNPVQNIKMLKTKKNIPHFIHEKEICSLLDNFKFKEDFFGLRDKIILELLYGTGIRLSELISLTDSKINFSNLILKVIGKRNKERIIPFSTHLDELLKKYISEKNTLFNSEFLIVTNSGEKSYPNFIYRIVKKFLLLIPNLEKSSPHILRHTYATHLLNKGADLNAVKDLLGHSSLSSTQIYTHNSIKKLKNVFDKAHPKA